MKYVVYWLTSRDFSENEMYAEYRDLLKEVDGESRFDTKEEAIERTKELLCKGDRITILEVYFGE